MKWYYSLYVRGNGTGTVFKPLFISFPDDANLTLVAEQFMLGDELLGNPVLREGNFFAECTE